jgi:serine phosphatase RsbU (regulator of sigma subunit)
MDAYLSKRGAPPSPSVDSRGSRATGSKDGERDLESLFFSGMSKSPESDEENTELRRLLSETEARDREIRALGKREHRHENLVARLRHEADVRNEKLAELRARLGAAELELKDLRAIRDALTPPELPSRPGLELAAVFLPAAEHVSGDFYLVAEGPKDSTLLIVGDVAGHGLQAGRRAAFVRTTFAATAPFSDDPGQLLSWANTALVERAGTSGEFVTAACVTYLPNEQLLRWAYAGHPPALSMYDRRELVAPSQGLPLGIDEAPDYVEGSIRCEGPTGVLLYTDGLTEARHDNELFGLEGVRAVLDELESPSPSGAIAVLRKSVADFAYGSLTDDLCMLAARIDQGAGAAPPLQL